MEKALQYIRQRDIAVFYIVNGKVKCRFFDFAMPLITYLGSAGFTIGFALIPLLYFWKINITQSLITAVSLGLSHFLIHLIKRAVNRPRPNITLTNVHTFDIPLYYYSFPSGHTTAAFSVAISAGLLIPAFSLAVLFLAFSVGLSRIYLGVHYPTDVIIGAMIGGSSVYFVKAVLNYFL